MSDYRRRLLEISTVVQLSLADLIVLDHRLGRPAATDFARLVDPWCYPGEKTPATVAAKRYFQSVLDKAETAGRIFLFWTTESMSAYLLSPLLLRRGERPALVRAGLKRADTGAELGAAADASTAAEQRSPQNDVAELSQVV